MRRFGFTLIELLVVIAIVAILSVVVILVLNPAELVRQARDSNRLQDLGNINTALNLFQTDTGGSLSLGTASTTYVSIPDPAATSTAGTNCASLGLPSLPTGWSYHCAASSTYRLVNGTGWLPVDLTQISFKSPLALLPVDPVNATSSGQYYTYTPGGSWELTAIPESQKYRTKYKMTPLAANVPGVIAMGTDFTLSPLFNTTGLVGYWTFDEGSGAQALDQSGNGNVGTWSGTGSHWTTGKIGGGGQFNGTDDSVDSASAIAISGASPRTITAWIKPATFSGFNEIQGAVRWGTCSVSNLSLLGTRNNGFFFWGINADVQGTTKSLNTWYYVAFVYNGSTGYLYADGVFDASASFTLNTPSTIATLGGTSCVHHAFAGTIDDVRIYNRALSAAEIAAIYNATK